MCNKFVVDSKCPDVNHGDGIPDKNLLHYRVSTYILSQLLTLLQTQEGGNFTSSELGTHILGY